MGPPDMANTTPHAAVRATRGHADGAAVRPLGEQESEVVQARQPKNIEGRWVLAAALAGVVCPGLWLATA